MELKLGTMSLGIFQTPHLLISLKVTYMHDPIGVQYLFYLRVSLSLLGSHKNRHKFDDTLLTKVFLTMVLKMLITFYFRVPFFTIQRATVRAS